MITVKIAARRDRVARRADAVLHADRTILAEIGGLLTRIRRHETSDRSEGAVLITLDEASDLAALAPEERDEVAKGLNSDSMIRVADVDPTLIAGGLELGRAASKMNV